MASTASEETEAANHQPSTTPATAPGSIDREDPAVPAPAEGGDADRVLDDQDRQQDGGALDRVHAQSDQRHGERAEAGEAALGEADQKHGGNREEIEAGVLRHPSPVIPAKAGISLSSRRRKGKEIPAFAGMTGKNCPYQSIRARSSRGERRWTISKATK